MRRSGGYRRLTTIPRMKNQVSQTINYLIFAVLVAMGISVISMYLICKVSLLMSETLHALLKSIEIINTVQIHAIYVIQFLLGYFAFLSRLFAFAKCKMKPIRQYETDFCKISILWLYG